jgi:hypothetical protein
MTLHERKARGGEKGEHPEKKAVDHDEDDCRCKEVSKKTVPELLKVVISDLAFWKKSGIKK